MRQRLPDTTSNISLAIVLHLAGLPIFKAWRVFTPDSLKRLGFRTIEEAHAKRAQGQVQIANEHRKNLQAITAIFDRVSAGEVEEIPDLYIKVGDDFRKMNESELVATIATMTLKVRSQLVDSLAQASNYILRMTDGEPTVDKSNPEQPVIHFPACRLLSANASEETKAKILNEH